GPDHVLLGTDYPYDMAEYDPLGHIAAVEGFDAATVAALAGRNAKKLLDLERGIERDFRPDCGKGNARRSAGILLEPGAYGSSVLKTMDRRRYAGAAAQRIFQVDRPVVLFQQIAERFVGEFLKILHLIAAEKIDLSPSLVVELHPLTGHQLAFLWRA